MVIDVAITAGVVVIDKFVCVGVVNYIVIDKE